MIPAIDDARISRGMKERPWTAEHDAILLRLSKAGLTIPIIAERLGRSKDACTSRKVRITSKPETVPPARDYLAERIEAYLGRIAKLNDYTKPDLKRECYGWR